MSIITVIGGGKIGEALIAGMVAAGMNPKDIHVSNRTPERGQELKDTYGVVPFEENGPAVDHADLVFLCVKPSQILGVVEEIATVVDNNDATTVVSMAAGVKTSAIEEVLSAGAPVVRVMPNTPMMVGKGVSAVAPGRFVGPEQLALVLEVLAKTGTVLQVAEPQMDAVTAMSGSSPAYVFLLAEAMMDAGVQLGLTRAQARTLVTGSLAGAGAMLEQLEKEPVQLRADVTSPGGTTAAAIRELEESGLRGAVYRAAQACADRSHELG